MASAGVPSEGEGARLQSTLPEGLAARYLVKRPLGTGSYGSVVLATDLDLGRPVALKLLHLDDELARARFEAEARLTAALEHPGIVRVYDHGTAPDGTSFIAYEFVDGPDLGSVVRRRGRPSQAELRRWGAQVAEALAVAHDAGVIHRDVKPANVLLRGEDAVLCDFGLAKGERGQRSLRTRTGMFVGSPFYLAPEAWQGGIPGPAADQWALAVSLARLALDPGREDLPHPVTELANQLRIGLAGPEVMGILEPLGDLGLTLGRALAPDPQERFADLRGLAAALREEPASRPATSGPRPLVSGLSSGIHGGAPGGEPRRRVPPLAILGLAGVLGGMVFLRSATSSAPATPALPATAEPDRGAVERARERMEESVRAVLREHGPVPAHTRFTIREFRQLTAHARPLLEVLADTQFEIQSEDMIRDLGAWVEALVALGGAPSPEERARLVELLGVVGHLMVDHRAANYSTAVADSMLLSSDIARYLQRSAPFREARLESYRQLAARLRRWPDPAPASVRTFDALLGAIHEDAALPGALERLLAPWPVGPDQLEERLERLDGTLMVLEEILFQGHVGCAARAKVLGRLRALYMAEDPPRPRAERFRFLGHLSQQEVTYLAACPEEAGPERWRRLDEILAILIAEAAEPAALRELARAMSDNLEDRRALYGEPPAALAGRIRRLAEAGGG